MTPRSGIALACALLVATVATSSAYASASFGIERYTLTASEKAAQRTPKQDRTRMNFRLKRCSSRACTRARMKSRTLISNCRRGWFSIRVLFPIVRPVSSPVEPVRAPRRSGRCG